ncbi:MAG: ABC transporter substrate-binding protein [Pseudomonadota bacterium]
MGGPIVKRRELGEKLRAGALARRDVNKLIIATGATLLAAPYIVRRAQAAPADQPMYFGWSGYDDPNLWVAYKEKFGELPRFTFFGDEEEGIAKMVAGFKPDVVNPCSYNIEKWWSAGLLEEIDVSRLKHWPDIIDSLKTLGATMVNGKHVAVPVDWGQTSVTYRTDLAPEYVNKESYEILWDPKYKKRVAVFDSLIDGVSIAAIMAGVDPFKYTDDSIAKTKKKLEELAQNVLYFSNDTTTMEQALASGELVAATTWNDSWNRLKKQGLKVRFMDPKEKRETWVCNFCIAKGTKLRDRSHDMIDAFLDPRSRVWEMENMSYGGSTKAGFAKMTDQELADAGLTRDPEKFLKSGIFQSPIENQPKLEAMFNEVKASMGQ